MLALLLLISSVISINQLYLLHNNEKTAKDLDKLLLITACNQLEINKINWMAFEGMCMNCNNYNVITLNEKKDKEINEFICKMGICKEIDIFSTAAQDKFNKFLQKHNLKQCPWPLTD